MSELPRPRILVAEDDTAVAKLICYNLERAGFLVRAAMNGQAALDIADGEDVDLLVTDENMPVMSGVELCQRLRTDKRYSDTPIVFLTAKQYEMETQQLEDELKVSVIIGKPFSPKKFVATIASLIADRCSTLA